MHQAPTLAPTDPAADGEGILGRGTSIGRFVVLGLLGKGGMGEVYAAHDPELDRDVAIKLLRGGAASESPEGRMRLMREAQAIARVSHPNVVVVYDVGTFGNRVFIAMELVAGHTLRYWTARARRGPGPRSWRSSRRRDAGWRQRTSASWFTATSSPTTS